MVSNASERKSNEIEKTQSSKTKLDDEIRKWKLYASFLEKLLDIKNVDKDVLKELMRKETVILNKDTKASRLIDIIREKNTEIDRLNKLVKYKYKSAPEGNWRDKKLSHNIVDSRWDRRRWVTTNA